MQNYIYIKYVKPAKQISLSNLTCEVMQYQVYEDSHNQKALQLTEQGVVSKQFDLLGNISKKCETKFYRCAACVMLPVLNSIKFEN